MFTDNCDTSLNHLLQQIVPPPHIAAMIGVTDLLPKFAFVNLRPGELIITEQPTIVTTLLGSCISICLYHPLKKIGGICHCLLPSKTGSLSNRPPYSFVNDALSHMVEVIEQDYHIPRRELKVKLFGGADVLQTRQMYSQHSKSIGLQNIEAAHAVIERYGLEITSQKVGGDNGYKLFFNTQTGEVFVRGVSCRAAEDFFRRNSADGRIHP